MSRVKSKGFTLIEISLAMAFISLLLLSIATVTIQIGRIYNRGLTLKEVNQLARNINDDITKDLSASPPFSLNVADKHLVNVTDLSGRLCLGVYSYVWNYGKNLAKNGTGVVKYSDNKPVGLARIPDADASYCATDNNGVLLKKTVDKNTATELIATSDHELSIHDFNIVTSPTATDGVTGQQMYTISYTIGTNNQDVLKKVNGVTVCQQPGDDNPDPEFCVVQQFTIVARAQNAVN